VDDYQLCAALDLLKLPNDCMGAFWILLRRDGHNAERAVKVNPIQNVIPRTIIPKEYL
jgi:hypothetical protein